MTTTNTTGRWQREGVELLLSLVKSKRYESLDPDYRMTGFAPRLWGAESSFIRLNNKLLTGLFTMDFKVVKRKNDVLKAVSSAAEYRPANRPPDHRVEVPFDSEVYRTLYSGSSVRLVVPADERLDTRAQQWLKSEDPEARQQGALAVQFFKSPANTELLRPLLNDTAYMTTTRDGVSTRVYYVKEADVKSVVLPPRSPNLNSYLERLCLSLKSECLNKMILFGRRRFAACSKRVPRASSP